MCQFCRPLENLLQRDRHPAVLRPFLPLLTKFHSKSKPLLGRCYQKPLAAAIKFHRAWEASGLFPDKLKKFEKEIENLQQEVENHEEILVNLQGYGSGIGRWGSVGRGKSKAPSRGSQTVDGPSTSNRMTSRGNRRERNPFVGEGNEDAAASDDSRSSSRRTEHGEEEEAEEEEEEEEAEEEGEEGEEGEEERSGKVSGRKPPAQDATSMSRPRVSIPRHRDTSVAPPRSVMRRTHPAGVIKPEREVSPRTLILSPGPESPKTTKTGKPRFRFRKGVKAYMNELFEYKVDDLVEQKVERRLALERSKEPSRAPASGVSKRNVTFPEGVKPADLSSPGAKRPVPSKTNNKRSIAKVAQPDGPGSSRVRQSLPYRARNRTPAPALYRVGNTRRGERLTTPKSALPNIVGNEPLLGNPDAEEREGAQDEWVDDVEEEENINEPAGNAGIHIIEAAEVVADGASAAASRVPNHGSPDADDGVYQDIRDMARIRDFGPAPDAAAFNALHVTVEDDVTSDGGSVDPVRLVRDLWPNLGPERPDPRPRRPLNKRHGFVNLRTV